MLLGSGAGDGFDGKANATAGAAKSRTTRAILRDFIMGFLLCFLAQKRIFAQRRAR
jgi:hypothetical protein